MSTETKVKKVKELFVQDLARIHGGAGQPQKDKGPKCPSSPPSPVARSPMAAPAADR